MDAPLERHKATTLLTLPLEIRWQIYTYVLKRGTIYFYPFGNNVGEWVLNTPTYSVHSRQDFQSHHGGDWDAKHKLCRSVTPGTICDCPDRLLIGILYTCRQVHAEASQILWSKNTFHFEGPTALTKILTEIGMLNRAALRSLSMRIAWADTFDFLVPKNWMLAICKPFLNRNSLLKDLQGLQALRVEIALGSIFKKPYFQVQRTMNELSYNGARETSDVLTSLPLETVEVIVKEGFFTYAKDDLNLYLERIEDQLIEGFTPQTDKPLYRPPKIKVTWNPNL